jgi:hypothetical protein
VVVAEQGEILVEGDLLLLELLLEVVLEGVEDVVDRGVDGLALRVELAGKATGAR